MILLLDCRYDNEVMQIMPLGVCYLIAPLYLHLFICYLITLFSVKIDKKFVNISFERFI